MKQTKKLWLAFFLALLLAALAAAGMTAAAEEETPEIIDSGYCGGEGLNLVWSLDSEGTLSITGDGMMKDYSITMSFPITIPSPWYNDSRIKKVVVSPNVTTVSQAAFLGCENLETAVLPESLAEVNSSAFYSCGALKSIIYAGSEAQWNEILIDNGPTLISSFDDTPFRNANIHYNVVAWGYCGDNLTWTLDSNGTLTISGTGAVAPIIPPDAQNESDEYYPWDNAIRDAIAEKYGFQHEDDELPIKTALGLIDLDSYFLDLRAMVDTVVVEEGVTGISRNAFYNYMLPDRIVLPASLQSMHETAFNTVLATSLTFYNPDFDFVANPVIAFGLAEENAPATPQEAFDRFVTAASADLMLRGTKDLGDAAYTSGQYAEMEEAIVQINNDSSLSEEEKEAALAQLEAETGYSAAFLADLLAEANSFFGWNYTSLADMSADLLAALNEKINSSFTTPEELFVVEADGDRRERSPAFEAALDVLDAQSEAAYNNEYTYERFSLGEAPAENVTPVPWLTIHGYLGSTAETAAAATGVKFVPLCPTDYIHTVTDKAEIAPTGTAIGHTAGWYCEDCGTWLNGEVIPPTADAWGYCGGEGEGTNLVWTLTGNTLTVSGEGAMMDYTDSAPAPWMDYFAAPGAELTVILEAGVTYIGENAFPASGGLKELIVLNRDCDLSALEIHEPAFLRGFLGSTAEDYGNVHTEESLFMPLCDVDYHHAVDWKVEWNKEEDLGGHTEGVYCFVCDDYLYARFAAHTWSDWETTKEATSEDNGLETRTCSVCGKEETREIGKTNGGIMNLILRAMQSFVAWFKKLLRFFSR